MNAFRGRGAKPVTIKDIAAVLGVSDATVSRALADSPLISLRTKDRVRAKAAEMGYVPDSAARMMRGEASNLVGFILPDVQNHFYSTMAKLLAENVSTLGLQLVLAISEGNPERELHHVRELRRARARGIIITPSAAMRSETADLLSGIRTVQLVRSHPLVRADTIAAQDEQAMFLATSHLLVQGHRHIAYMGGGAEILDSGVRRLAGYRNAMAGQEGSCIVECLTPPHPESGYREACRLLGAATRPSALVIASPQLALGVLRAIRELNLRIPQDVALVSYDDPDWLALCDPGISAIALPIAEMAHFAVGMIAPHYRTDTMVAPPMLVAGKSGRHHFFPVTLIPRGQAKRHHHETSLSG